MRKLLIAAIGFGLGQPSPAAEPVKPEPALSPSEIVEAAKAEEWVGIAPADLLVMDLAPGAMSKPRRVVIQLINRALTTAHATNVRKLAVAHWWDGLSINRVQDDYVVQWGDASETKALPPGLENIDQSTYQTAEHELTLNRKKLEKIRPLARLLRADSYAPYTDFEDGWPLASDLKGHFWPVHCYAAVGVGRNLPPDTGSGAELYTVIGHAPRHLDRNIAVVGRVIEGIEHLSSLPRGTGPLGFYETADERVPIRSIRPGTEVPGLPAYQYLSTESQSFARYAEARANRRDAFFVRPAGGADICNIPVPVRKAKASP